MKKIILIIFTWFLLCGASYQTLDIINVDEVGANNRIKYAYTGIQYDVCIVAEGGQYPYVWELTTAPSGMTIDSHTGIITWSSPTESGSPHNVTVQVTDGLGTTDTESFTVTVTTSTDRFIFVQDGYSGTKTGSISQPYEDMTDFWDHENDSDKIVYFRTGTYHVPHDLSGSGSYSVRNSCSRAYIQNGIDPVAFIGYPGESAKIDFESTGSAGYGFIVADATCNDVWFSNLEFDNIYFYGLVNVGQEYFTVYDCTFSDATTSDASSNQSYINYMAGGATNNVISNNIFTGPVTGGANFSAIEVYNTTHSVTQNNIAYNLPHYGFFLKQAASYYTIRGNEAYNCAEGIGLLEGYDANYIEICYNYTHDNTNWGIYVGPAGNITNCYIYRNTIDDSIQVRIADVYGFYGTWLNNVFQNALVDSGTIGVDDPFYRHRTNWRYVNATEYSQSSYTNNLEGTSGIIDSNGNLQGDYTSYLGTTGWQIADDEYYGGSPSTPSFTGVMTGIRR